MKILTLLILLPTVAFCQNFSSDDFNPTRLDSVVYKIPFSASDFEKSHLPFSKIEILDLRFDTSKLGFIIDRITKNTSFNDFKKLKLASGIAPEIQRFYNEYFKHCFTESDDKLLIVLKRLWINYAPSNPGDRKRYDFIEESVQNIYTKFEYYMHRGEFYYPLFRKEKTYQLSGDSIKEKNNDLSFFRNTLIASIKNEDFSSFFAKAGSGKKMIRSEIDSFNAKRLMIPSLLATKFNQGVFLNSLEFINNEPSVKEFKKNQKGKLISIGEKKAGYMVYFAFADENGIHIKDSKNSQLFRINNCFEFLSEEVFYFPKSAVEVFLDAIPAPQSIYGMQIPQNMTSSQTKIKVIFVPRQLDMETGEVY